MLVAVVLVAASLALIALTLIAVFLYRRARAAEARARELHEVAVRYDGIRGMEAALHSLDRARADLETRMQAARDAHESERAAMHADSQRARAQLDAQMQNVRASYESEHTALTAELNRLRRDIAALEETEYLHSIGLYEPRYDFETADDYRAALERIRDKQKGAVKGGRAARCETAWVVEGSRKKGEQMTRNSIKLALRAFNGECDASITKVKYNNIHAIAERIRKARDTVNRLSRTDHVEITDEYLKLKLDELALFHEYAEKKQEEKEEQRRIKEQMREEARAQQELERAQQEAEDDERRYASALERARAEVEHTTGAKHQKLLDKVTALQQKLAEAQANRERAISRAQMTRSGHVYVISNIGSFGDDVLKIGMTRRLDPQERVKELGDASVPFGFDVHAMIFTEDAPALERELHRRFHERRVNLVNERKEFFTVTLDEVRQVVEELHGRFELTKLAEAVEWRKTVVLRGRTGASGVSPAVEIVGQAKS